MLEDSRSSYLLLDNIFSTFKFRHIHWGMVKKYIIDNIRYPKATGGTPITTWLPNQLGACLEYCQSLIVNIDPAQLSPEEREHFKFLEDSVNQQIRKLFDEVQGLQSQFDNQEIDQFQKRS